MTKDEALKLALKALEGVLDDAPKVLDASIAGGLYEVIQCRDAITAIKKALANDALDKKAENARELGLDYEPEPLAFINVEQRKLEWAKYMTWDTPTVANLPKIPLYTTPPQRTWVELTDEEVMAIAFNFDVPSLVIRTVEAKLKQRNT